MAESGSGSADRAFAELTIGKHQTPNNVAMTPARILFMRSPTFVIYGKRKHDRGMRKPLIAFLAGGPYLAPPAPARTRATMYWMSARKLASGRSARSV